MVKISEQENQEDSKPSNTQAKPKPPEPDTKIRTMILNSLEKRLKE